MAQRGRPRAFERDKALHAMMEVFWARGYEGAQLVDLTAAAGIAPPSFYAAFGSKEEAFCESVDYYITTVGAIPMQELDNAANLNEGLLRMFQASIDIALSMRPGGCLLILGVVNCLTENEAARTHLKAARDKTRELIHTRLKHARAAGELSPDCDIQQRSAFIHGIMQMISFQARDGATRDELEALVALALGSLAL
ncbi:TetR family transcriptional regulator [Pectobacterium actinidiae]|uniref:TetR family transcriptional regulator n=1 Tax=Pectobacterium actinidiae TaxID=1507808 RepID=A0A1V2R6T3_9GAMM|nr:TetR/AcrR family transcriptional regulator [Pectobacterium actinidiae]KHN92926.1 regulatory protein TetR [Pectobacterium actinidiae]ONK05776.1 TetR family transcriptional regulator [Pectobacterium actinidiae]ONK08118.1 TetR family transcriptional regulator [Pectobacterium actinidiae]